MASNGEESAACWICHDEGDRGGSPVVSQGCSCRNRSHPSCLVERARAACDANDAAKSTCDDAVDALARRSNITRDYIMWRNCTGCGRDYFGEMGEILLENMVEYTTDRGSLEAKAVALLWLAELCMYNGSYRRCEDFMEQLFNFIDESFASEDDFYVLIQVDTFLVQSMLLSRKDANIYEILEPLYRARSEARDEGQLYDVNRRIEEVQDEYNTDRRASNNIKLKLDKELLEDTKKKLGKDNWSYVVQLIALAVDYHEAGNKDGNFAEGAKSAKEAYSISFRLFGPDHKHTAAVRSDIKILELRFGVTIFKKGEGNTRATIIGMKPSLNGRNVDVLKMTNDKKYIISLGKRKEDGKEVKFKASAANLRFHPFTAFKFVNGGKMYHGTLQFWNDEKKSYGVSIRQTNHKGALQMDEFEVLC